MPDSPKFLCLLGEVTNEPEHWERAWTISGNRYARAKRLLGTYYLRRGELAEFIHAFHAALAINPLFSSNWFDVGCAAMKLERWQTASEAFQRVIFIDSESGEAWANLASVQIRLGQKKEAAITLREGFLSSRDRLEDVDNFLYLCLSKHW